MDPELLKALAGAGMTEEQLRMLGPQLQMGQQMMQPQMAQGSQVGTGPFQTYVAASPLEHLSNAVRQIIGAKIARGAMDKQQALLGQQQKARQGAFQGLQTAMSGGQGGTLGEAGGGMARPPDPQAAQALMMAMAGSGDPALQAGAHFGQQSQHLQNELSRLQNTQQYQQGMLGIREQGIQQKEREQGSATDAYGNPILYKKHALPGAVGAGTPQAGGERNIGLTSDALDNAAEMFARTGTLPPLRGKAGAAMTMRIQNRAAELHPELDLAGNKAGYGADTSSLKGLQKQADAMNSFEGTALRNLDQFLESAKGVVDTGSPLFNAPARRFMQSVAGDPKMTAFNVSRQVAVQEISKVLGGSLGNAAVSDSARHEVAGLIGPDASLAQIFEAARILKSDMANRKAAMAEQIAQVHTRAGKGALTPAAAAPAPATAAPAGPEKVSNDAEFNALPSGTVFVGPDGKQRKKP